MMTIEEYDRQWDLIMNAFRTGFFSVREASDAIRDLTQRRTSR